MEYSQQIHNLLGNHLILGTSNQQQGSIVFHRQFGIIKITIFSYGDCYNTAQECWHTWQS